LALTVSVSGNATIESVSNFKVGESSSLDPGYGIFPGSINLDDPENPVWNDPVAPSDDPGAAGTGLGTNTVIIEMGSLYDPDIPGDAPLDADGLIDLQLAGNGDASTTVTITKEETHRGGIVMEDGNPPGSDSMPGCTVLFECFPSCHDDYSEWLAVGSPECWCYPRQCHGDADGQKQGNVLSGYTYVSTDDLNVLMAGWKVLEPTKGPGIDTIEWNGIPGICADFAHNKQGNVLSGYARVSTDDLNQLMWNWKILEPTKGPGIPPDCLDCP
jgi:hypothetical protein